MKTPKNRKPFLRTSGISVGLATFLVVGLGGCDGSNDSLATKQQKCKLQEYRLQHQDECQYIKNEYGNTSVNNTGSSHNSGSSWVPMWMMLHSMNNNAHSGYSYSSDSGSKSSGYFSSSSSRSTSSSGGHSSSSSGG